MIRKNGLKGVRGFRHRQDPHLIRCSARGNYGFEQDRHFLTVGLFVSETSQELPAFIIRTVAWHRHLQVHGKRKRGRREGGGGERIENLTINIELVMAKIAALIHHVKRQLLSSFFYQRQQENKTNSFSFLNNVIISLRRRRRKKNISVLVWFDFSRPFFALCRLRKKKKQKKKKFENFSQCLPSGKCEDSSSSSSSPPSPVCYYSS